MKYLAEIDLLKTQNELQSKEIELLKREIEGLKESLDSVLVKIADDKEKFENKVVMKVQQIMAEKERYIMDMVSKYVEEKCMLKQVI